MVVVVVVVAVIVVVVVVKLNLTGRVFFFSLLCYCLLFLLLAV